MVPDHPRAVAITTIAGFPATLTAVPVGGTAPRDVAPLRLYTVVDLERLVDRAALLRGDAEPPYWAYLWSGGRCLAEYLARWTALHDRRVLEIGCGLGLPGVVAAAAGARVTFVDGERAALAFVRASLDLNALPGALVCADYRTLSPAARFDVILAAEVAYEPDRFGDLVAALARHLAPGGTVLLADGFRSDTRALYRALAQHRFATLALDLRVTEEGRSTRIRLTEARRAGAS